MSFFKDRPSSILSEPTEENRESEAANIRQQLVDDIANLVVRQFRRQRENSAAKTGNSHEELKEQQNL